MPARVRQVLARVGPGGSRRDLQQPTAGRPRDALHAHRGQDHFALVFGVVGHRARSPRRSRRRTELDRSGCRRSPAPTQPAHSLRDAPDCAVAVLAKSRQISRQFVAYIDTRRVLEVMSGHGTGTNDALASMFAGKIPQACQDDVARMTAVLPRTRTRLSPARRARLRHGTDV